MEGKGIKIFGVVMAFLLVFSFAATFSVSSTVSAGTQKWTKITIPGADDMQLAPLTDVGAIAVSPDGGTLFAAVVGESTHPTIAGVWYVYKSVDGGFTWKVTGFTDDGSDIVDIKVSPAWDDDNIVVVATQSDAYYSEDGAKTFESMGATALAPITCMDIGKDEDADATYALGNSSDVCILSGFSGWVPQYVGGTLSINTVLDVAFSPNYGEDGIVYAVVTAGSLPTNTLLRGESDITVNNWGSFIQDAVFTNKDYGNIVATHACITFAEDYNSAPSIFVGLQAIDDLTGTYVTGDAFRVDLVTGTIGTSAVNDLNIRGEDTRTDVWSLAVSGDASSAFILAGLCDLNNTGPMADWTAQVHYSNNGGESWLQCYKPPSGMGGGTGMMCRPNIVMAPDFAESGIAYCGNGFIDPLDPDTGPIALGGFFVSATEGTTWNGRGLLDHDINAITDVVPSPDYDNDDTLFMVTRDASVDNFGLTDFGLLWETKDGGSTWELILGMTTMIPLPGVAIDKIEIPATYPEEPSLFVTGLVNPFTTASALIVRSTDEGNLFATTLKAPYLGTTPLPVQTWVVIDKDTLIVSNGGSVYKTTDMGAHWKLPTQADIETAAGETITDMEIYNDTTIIVGTNYGNVFICQDWENDFSFTEAGNSPCIVGDLAYVAFDTNFDDNGFVYAGISGSNDTDGIWRIEANTDEDWSQIYPANPVAVPATDVTSIACDGNGIVWALLPGAADNTVRSVNPNTELADEVVFEPVEASSVLNIDLETAPTATYVFAIGGSSNTELWAYIDTLIKPTLISPADGATAAGTILEGTSNALVSLRWDDLAKAKDYQYQIAYDEDFGSIATDSTTSLPTDNIVEGTQITVGLILGQEYFWHVRVNSSVLSQWSDTWSFTTPLGPASAKPIVTYPGGQFSHNDIELTPTLTWTSTVEATGFELMLAENCDWANPAINLTGSSALGADTCYSITQALKEGTNYCWKVRAINSDTDTMSPWSDTATFTTLVTPVVEEEGTPMWVWVVIALSAVLLVGVVVLIVRTRRPV